MKMFENVTPAKINRRFNSRTMTRREYEYWYRRFRKSCIDVPSDGYGNEQLSSHFHRITNDHQWRRAIADWPQRERDLQAYGGVSDEYKLYVDETLADYGGMLQEQQIDRQATLYHLGLYPDGGLLVVG